MGFFDVIVDENLVGSVSSVVLVVVVGVGGEEDWGEVVVLADFWLCWGDWCEDWYWCRRERGWGGVGCGGKLRARCCGGVGWGICCCGFRSDDDDDDDDVCLWW